MNGTNGDGPRNRDTAWTRTAQSTPFEPQRSAGGRHSRHTADDDTAAFIVGNGKPSDDRQSNPPEKQRQPGRWIVVVTSAATLVLIAAAITDIALQLSGADEKTTTVTQVAPPPPPAPAEPAPVPPSPTEGPPPSAVIATACRANSSVSLTADGSDAYCEHLATTDRYLWSLYPGEIPLPDTPGDPAVGVCMVQTERSESDCVEYLQRPSNPGDGGAGA